MVSVTALYEGVALETLLSPLRGLIGVSLFPWVGTHGYGLSALRALGLLR